ncbi:MAG: hypothetical protein ACREE5_12630 [Acetobacteraceae bacterium]
MAGDRLDVQRDIGTAPERCALAGAEAHGIGDAIPGTAIDARLPAAIVTGIGGKPGAQRDVAADMALGEEPLALRRRLAPPA